MVLALGLMGTSSLIPLASSPSHSRYHTIAAVDDTAEAVANRAAGKFKCEAHFKRLRGYEKKTQTCGVMKR
jgi:hypothetical protein